MTSEVGRNAVGKLDRMLPITNPKVLTLDPTWTRFVGYSLLFDNPGDSFHRGRRLERIHCDVDTDPRLVLYRELSRAISGIERDEPGELGLCLLPPTSYHVTFFDGGNQANAGGAHPECKSHLIQLIEGLPESWNEEHDLVRPATQTCITLATHLPISFRYSHLKHPNNEVLVAALVPSDPKSKTNLDRLTEARADLSAIYRTSYGFGAGPRFTPHVSLAYFANKEGGERASERIEGWNNALHQRTEDLRIFFRSMSIYAFTDMATFFREKWTP